MKSDYMTGYDNGYVDGVKAEREKHKLFAGKPATPVQLESAKPVMWFVSKDPDDEGFVVHKEREAKDCEQDGYDVTPLYAAPKPAQVKNSG